MCHFMTSCTVRYDGGGGSGGANRNKREIKGVCERATR